MVEPDSPLIHLREAKPETDAGHWRPRPWIAALASMIIPGLGQVYGRSIISGMIAYAVMLVCVVGTLFLFRSTRASAGVVQVGVAMTCLVWLIIVAHAAWYTKIPRKPLPRLVRWVKLLAAFVLAVGVGLAVLMKTRAHQLATYTVAGEAAAPALLTGDRVIINRSAYQQRDPQRGEVVMFRVAHDRDGIHTIDQRPFAPKVTYAMRIVAVPGDRVAVRRGVIYLNTRPIKPPRNRGCLFR